MSSIKFPVTATLAAFLLAGTAVVAEEIDRTVDADPSGTVVVSNISGEVEIYGWDRNEVRVYGELSDDIEEFIFERDGNRIVVKVQHPDRHRHSHDMESELEIQIPRKSDVEVHTISAEITVSDVEGSRRLETVSGDIETDVYKDDLEVRTVSGDVEIVGRDEAALITVNTISGDAEITGVRGEIEAQTVSGDVDLRLEDIKRLRMRSTNGDMSLHTSLRPDGRLEAETINGEVEVILSGEINSSFDVETFNGDIDNCFGPEARRTSKYAPGRELRFTEGNASSRVRIKTLNGGVTLCRD